MTEPLPSDPDQDDEPRLAVRSNPYARILGVAVFAIVICGVLLKAMLYRLGPELADDGAFFLRYAVNMAHGHFWVWNAGGSPVWGASDPLWPVVVSIPIAFGAPALGTMVALSITLSIVSLGFVSLVLMRRVGYVAAAAFVVFASLDTGLMYYSGAGLETPLTVAFLAAAVGALLWPAPMWLVGVIAGLLMVNKVDLIPAAVFLLAAYGLDRKMVPKMAIVISGGIAVIWYVFAWLYFGSPVPNSFLTKTFHQGHNPSSLRWTWFGKYVLSSGMHRWLVVLFVAGIAYAIVRRSTLMVFLAGLLIVDLIGYTIKYPFEPYDWYAMPAVFVLIVGAATGAEAVAGAVPRLVRIRPTSGWGVLSSLCVGAAILLLIAVPDWHREKLTTQSTKSFSQNQERDRADAGRWVARNTPRNFVVYTLWGNPAAFSNRYVIDGSFLNRAFETGDLVAKYRPDVLILENNPGSTPSHPIFAFDTNHYSMVRIFDVTYQHSMDYFFAVFIRDDDLSRLPQVR